MEGESDIGHQPATFTFPKRSFGVKKPVLRSFQSEWFKQWSFLHYDEAKDVVYCLLCSKKTTSGPDHLKIACYAPAMHVEGRELAGLELNQNGGRLFTFYGQPHPHAQG